MDETSGTIAPSQVIINGQEFDAQEAQDLIETGRKTREYEGKYNTSFDKVWPEYNRVSQERKQLETDLTAARAELVEFQQKRQEGSETTQDITEAQEAARKLGIVLNDDLGKAGYIKRDDLDNYLDERDQRSQSINQVLGQADDLAKEIDGTDGRPKFNKKAVMAYASAYKSDSLLAAYEEMHEDSLKGWKEQQIASQRKPGLKTMGASGKKEPGNPKVTKDNFSDALSEALNGSSE